MNDRPPVSTSQKGQCAEQQAVRFLQRQGYRILQCNYRCRLGEIDIIAREGATLCFIEVRSTRDGAHDGPLATITPRKQRRIVLTARHYMAGHDPGDREIRFDVIGIVYSPRPRIQLVRGAFDGAGA